MQQSNAGSGLKKMFIAEIGMIICSVLLLIPLVNIIALVALLFFLVFSLVGLNQAGRDIEGCKTAFSITIARLVLSVLSRFLSGGFLGSLISIALSAADFLIIYFVCTSAASSLRAHSFEDIAATGEIVWKINLVCCAAKIVISVLVFIPLLRLLAVPASFIVSIASLVSGILYLIFLYKSSNVL